MSEDNKLRRMMVLFSLALVCAVLCAAYLSAKASPIQAAPLNNVESVSAEKYLAITFLPGIVATHIVMVAILAWRRTRREEGYGPALFGEIARRAVKWGVLVGPVCQLGLQRLSSSLTGLPVLWELVPMGAVLTGVGALAVHVLWQVLFQRLGWRKAYNAIRVPHNWPPYNDGRFQSPQEWAEARRKSKIYDVSSADLTQTIVAPQDEDRTEPKGE